MSEANRTPNGPVRFPARRLGDAPLVLPRGRLSKTVSRVAPPPTALDDASIPVVCAGSSEQGSTEPAGAAPRSVAELERALRALEAKLEERERQIAEQESWVAERARELAETEALVSAREAMVAATRKSQNQAPQRRGASLEEQIAIERVRTELDRREASLRETRNSLLEREKFLDQSEVRLFEKTQVQLEKETELEQWEEELNRRERRVLEAEAVHDPALAATLKTAAVAPTEAAE